MYESRWCSPRERNRQRGEVAKGKHRTEHEGRESREKMKGDMEIGSGKGGRLRETDEEGECERGTD